MTLRDDQPETLLEEASQSIVKGPVQTRTLYINRTTLTCVVNTAFTGQGLWISLICLGALVKQDGEKGRGQTETVLSKIERARAGKIQEMIQRKMTMPGACRAHARSLWDR